MGYTASDVQREITQANTQVNIGTGGGNVIHKELSPSGVGKAKSKTGNGQGDRGEARRNVRAGEERYPVR